MGVVNFYAGRSIFLTGGAGYVGRHLVEKLLRSCPEIQRIFLLLRGTNSLNSRQRYQQLLRSKLFDGIQDKNTLAKVYLVDGDLTLPGLGLSEFDRQRVLNDTSVVIHSGASINLAHRLDKTFPVNTIGTKQVMDLSKQMKKLETFVHISTAYSNTGLNERDEINENVYPPPSDLDEVLRSYKKPGYLDKLHDSAVPHKYGNGYVMSKAYTEALVERYSDSLPLSILRPSVVSNSWIEPTPGWTDCGSFVSSIIIGAGNGSIRAFNSPGKVIDLIPCDVVVDSVIVSAWDSIQKRKDGCKVPVYNCTSSTINPITWAEVLDQVTKVWLLYPMSHAYLYPNVYCTTNKIRLWKSNLTLSAAYVLFKVTGNSSMTWTQLKHVKSLLNYTKWVTVRHFFFKSENQKSLAYNLSDNEKGVFRTDISQMDWQHYLADYVKGIRKYILKETDDNLQGSRKKLRRLMWLSWSSRAAGVTSVVSASLYCLPPHIGYLLEML